MARDQHTARWQDVHRMFYTGMRCSGVGEEKAKVMYTAVYGFGPRWSEPKAGGTGRVPKAMFSTTLRRSPSEAEARRIEAWVRANNSSLRQIEQTTAIPSAPSP